MTTNFEDAIDVTVEMSPEMVTWEGVEPYHYEWVIRMDDVETTAHFDDESYVDASFANASFLHFTPHTGTHVDAPFHYDPDGKTMEEIDLQEWIRPVQVREFPEVDRINREDLRDLSLNPREGLILKTRNGDFYPESSSFNPEYVGVAPDAAQEIADRDIPLVGIDYLSVEPFEAYAEEDHATHRCLLRNEVLVVEGLDLRGVKPGSYQLIALPLRLKNLEASPARALLLPES